VTTTPLSAALVVPEAQGLLVAPAAWAGQVSRPAPVEEAAGRSLPVARAVLVAAALPAA